MTERPLRLGTRGSRLAMAQSQHVADALTEQTGLAVELVVVSTRGDRNRSQPLAQLGGKGLFTAELEEGLRQGTLDFAVHSLKDLPTDDPDGLVLGCIPVRESPWDVLVGPSLRDLRAGAVVGTGSLRRGSQLRSLRPDLTLRDIRGNVETRLRKTDEGQYEATVLAAAGLNRLGIHRDDATPFGINEMVPAVGQGALGVQCRKNDPRVLEALATLNDEPTARCVAAERAFLESYGGGCNVPAACHAWIDGGRIAAVAVAETASGALVRAEGTGDGPEVGMHLASQL